MAHLSQQRFLCLMRSLYPDYFIKKRVIDVGGSNICGSNRFLFKNCDYFSIDVWKGPEVDIVCSAKDIDFTGHTVICTEMLEHSPTWREDLANMAKIASNCLIVTFAINPRPEHGTDDTTPPGSPFKGVTYYMNMVPEDVLSIIWPYFPWIKWEIDDKAGDAYIIAWKNEPKFSPNRLTFLYFYFKIFILNSLHDFRCLFK